MCLTFACAYFFFPLSLSLDELMKINEFNVWVLRRIEWAAIWICNDHPSSVYTLQWMDVICVNHVICFTLLSPVCFLESDVLVIYWMGSHCHGMHLQQSTKTTNLNRNIKSGRWKISAIALLGQFVEYMVCAHTVTYVYRSQNQVYCQRSRCEFMCFVRLFVQWYGTYSDDKTISSQTAMANRLSLCPFMAQTKFQSYVG